MPTMTPSELNKTLATLRTEFCGSVKSLTIEQTQWRPVGRSHAWSIQQIVEHLLLTYKSTSGVLRERLAKGTPTRKPATVKQKCMQFIVTTGGYFPRGQEAPSFVRPSMDTPPQSGEELANAIAQSIAALDALIAESEQTLGYGRTVTHGVMGPMSMQQWRKFQLVHGRHHVRQIMAIRVEHGL